MIGSPARVSTPLSVTLPSRTLALPAFIKLALEHLAVARHKKTEGPINHCRKYIRLDIEALPIGIGQRRVGCAEQVEQADDDDERRILEAADKAVDQGRNYHRQCLRQNNQAGTAPITQAE